MPRAAQSLERRRRRSGRVRQQEQVPVELLVAAAVVPIGMGDTNQWVVVRLFVERRLEGTHLTGQVVDVHRGGDRLLVREVLVQRRGLDAELVGKAAHRQTLATTLLDQALRALDDLRGAR